MDVDPAERERNMVRWTLAGSAGVVAGPALLAVALAAGFGWRGAILAVAAGALPFAWIAPRLLERPVDRSHDGLTTALRGALTALRNREALRWLAALATSDLMLDVLHGFLALYFVDVVGASPVHAALAVSVWTSASLVGDALLLLVLRHARGIAYLRVSALVTAVVFPAFLVVPGLPAKLTVLAALGLLNSGWYAIPKAGLYAALPDRSGTVIAVSSLKGWTVALVLLGLGFSADAIGLAATMWLLLASPLGLLALVPRR